MYKIGKKQLEIMKKQHFVASELWVIKSIQEKFVCDDLQWVFKCPHADLCNHNTSSENRSVIL